MSLFVEKFNYHALDQITHSSGSRKYKTPDGRHLPSVTTILSKTGDKTGLLEWRKRVGEKEADKIVKEAASLGSLMHTHLEKHILGEERPGGSNLARLMAKKMADAIIERGLVNVKEVWGIEKGLYYPGLYAGTTDLIGLYENAPAIMDFKSSRKIKKDDHVFDYKIQIAAYSLAHNEVYGTDIKTGVIFMADRDYKFKSWILEGNEFKNACDLWLERLDEYYTKYPM